MLSRDDCARRRTETGPIRPTNRLDRGTRPNPKWLAPPWERRVAPHVRPVPHFQLGKVKSGSDRQCHCRVRNGQTNCCTTGDDTPRRVDVLVVVAIMRMLVVDKKRVLFPRIEAAIEPFEV